MATQEFFSAALVALAFGMVLALPVYRGLLAIKSRQIVSQYVQEHLKKQGTPTMGGLISVLAFLCGLAVLLLFRTGWREEDRHFLINAGVLFAGFSLIGFLDDFVVPRLIKGKRGLGWKQKIVMQVALAAGVVYQFLPDLKSPQLWLCVVIILAITNGYNFVDGMDGLAGSVLLALIGGLSGLTMILHWQGPLQPGLMATYGLLAGAILPFLYLNAPPAKIFMGDVGSMAIGSVLGLVFAVLGTKLGLRGSFNWEEILSQNEMARVLAVLLLSGVLMAEIVPVPMQIFWVKVFKKKLFTMTPIHHGFEKKGMPETRVVWSFAVVQAVLSVLAVGIAAWLLRIPAI